MNVSWLRPHNCDLDFFEWVQRPSALCGIVYVGHILKSKPTNSWTWTDSFYYARSSLGPAPACTHGHELSHWASFGRHQPAHFFAHYASSATKQRSNRFLFYTLANSYFLTLHFFNLFNYLFNLLAIDMRIPHQVRSLLQITMFTSTSITW